MRMRGRQRIKGAPARRVMRIGAAALLLCVGITACQARSDPYVPPPAIGTGDHRFDGPLTAATFQGLLRPGDESLTPVPLQGVGVPYLQKILKKVFGRTGTIHIAIYCVGSNAAGAGLEFPESVTTAHGSGSTTARCNPTPTHTDFDTCHTIADQAPCAGQDLSLFQVYAQPGQVITVSPPPRQAWVMFVWFSPAAAPTTTDSA
jgi:hypothetical protein